MTDASAIGMAASARAGSSAQSPPVHLHSGYRPDIDGLRAIAVTAVVLYHAGVTAISGGFAGVDIFFVISGYLIGSMLFRGTRDSQFSFADFYARRARRILPALLLVVAFTTLAGAVLLSAAEYRQASSSALRALLGISNFHYLGATGYFVAEAHLDPFLMTWSLAVEEQFYLFLPLLFLLLRRSDDTRVLRVLALVCLVSFVLCAGLAGHLSAFAFYMLPTRAWELCLGSLAGVWVVTGRWRPPGKLAEAISAIALAAIAATFLLVDSQTTWPGLATVAPVAATAALIMTPQSTINRKLLACAPFVGVGLISYSWYLWHWPLISLVHIAAIGEPTSAALIGAALVSLVLAVLSWRYVELPFRRASRPPGATIVRYGAALVAGVAAVALVVQLDGIASRVPPRANAIDEAKAALRADNCLVYRQVDLMREGCVHDPGGKPIFAVIGDSQGAAIAPAIIEHAKQAGQGWAIFSHGSCRPLTGVTVIKREDPAFAPICARYMANAFAWVAANPDVRDVMLSGLWTGPLRNPGERYARLDKRAGTNGEDLLIEGLDASVRRLVHAGKRVHVVLELPYWKFDPSRARISESIPARRWLATLVSRNGSVDNAFGAREPIDYRLQNEIARTAKRAGGSSFAVADVFCQSAGCRYRGGNSVYFIDRSHLSPDGARLAFSAFVNAMAKDASAGDPDGRVSPGRERLSLLR